MTSDTLPARTTFGIKEIGVGRPGIRIPREPSIHFDPKELHLIWCCRVMARQGVRDWVKRQQAAA